MSTAVGQPVAVAPRWQVNFPATAKGMDVESAAVPVGKGPTLVVVAGAGADPLNPKLQAGNREIPVKVIGYDPVSRLGFLKVEGPDLPKPVTWSDQVGQDSTA